MPKFRKKPVVIEAVRFDGTDASYNDVCAFAPGVHFDPTPAGFKVPTLEGEHLASPGDWIIRGVKGEIYPCKDEIFRLTYEPADDSPIASGDIVRLKSGGPPMTVARVVENTEEAECLWFGDVSALASMATTPSERKFPICALVRVGSV